MHKKGYERSRSPMHILSVAYQPTSPMSSMILTLYASIS